LIAVAFCHLKVELPHSRLPFNYGKNNKQLEQFEKGPRYNKKNECPNKEACEKKGQGKCMDSTSLEISWRKLDDKYLAKLRLGKQQLSLSLS
jgi:hypothetical protein